MKTILSLLALLTALAALPVQGAPPECSPNITVVNTNDNGEGSFRAALASVCPGGTITFAANLNGKTILLTSGQLSVSNSVTILGPGPGQLAIDGGGTNRVFELFAGQTNLIAGLTITHGNATNSDTGSGGGIENLQAVLTLSNVTIIGNSAMFGAGVDNNATGGPATLTLQDCTLSGNSTVTGGFGGGAYNFGDNSLAMLTLQNCTVSGNTANADAGALMNDGRLDGAIAIIQNCTFSGNFASSGRQGILNSGTNAALIIGDTLLGKGASGSNFLNDSGSVIDAGPNLSDDSSAGGFATTVSNLLLGPLQNNGGPTFTQALLPGSPAIDAGSSPSEIQQVTVGGSAGTFTLTFNGQMTSSLTFNATVANVQAALTALSTIGNGNATVTLVGNVYVITFGGALAGANQPQLAALGSGGATATVSTLADGGLPAFDQRGAGFPRVFGGAVDIGSFEDLQDLIASGASALTGTEGSPLGLPAVTVASFIGRLGTELPGDYTATINWGDGTSASSGAISQPSGPGTAFVVAGNHTYAEAGGDTITTTITHTSTGFSASATTSATISDAPLSTLPVSISPVVGVPLLNQTVAQFTDGNPNGAAADFTTDIDWGDGTPHSIGNLSQPGGVGTPFLVSGNHTYLTAEPLSVTVAINDIGGSTATEITSVNIAQASTGTTLSSSINPVLAGNDVTITAAVAASGGSSTVPTGTVSFTVDGGSATNASLGPNGKANLLLNFQVAGPHTIGGSYGGDNNCVTSTAKSLTQNVAPGPATHFAVNAPAGAVPGTAFMVTILALDQFTNVAAGVAAPFPSTNIIGGYFGTVHFTSTDGAAVLPANSTLINGSGTFTVTLNTSGSQTITATDTVNPALTGTSGPIEVCALNLTVMNTNDNGAGSLRAALAGICPGGTITFDPALNGKTILLTSGELAVSNSVTILGPGPGQLAIDGGGTNRVFHLSPGLTNFIAGLTITDGNLTTNGGGGILNDHAVLTLSNVTVSGNSSDNGGGIFNAASNGAATMTLISCTVSGNSAVRSPNFFCGEGGGILNDGENHGTATMTLQNCTLSGNSAATSGGGIFNVGDTDGNGALVIQNCTVSGNLAHGTNTDVYSGGGGIYNDGSGMFDDVSGSARATLALQNCTLSGNSADASSGGGIANDGSVSGNATLTLQNCTLSGNSASGSGGGTYNDATNNGSAVLIIGDTVLAKGASGVNFFNDSGSVIDAGPNLSDDSSASGFATTVPNLLLGPLQNNGGPTLTQAPLSGSPAIDAGGPLSEIQQVTVGGSAGTFTLTFNGQTTPSLAFNATVADVQGALNALSSIAGVGGSATVSLNTNIFTVVFGGALAGANQAPLAASGSGGATATVTTLADGGLPTFDQRGPGFPRVFGGAVDIGAVESGCQGTITVVNTKDNGAGSLRAAIADICSGGTITFDPSLNGQSIVLASELTVSNNVTILGPGADQLAINGGGASRVFYLNPGLTNLIAGLTITNGFDSSGFGGGIYNDHAVLTLSNVTVSGNTASLDEGNNRFLGTGGGICNQGSSGSATLMLQNCTIGFNSAANVGGGIFNGGVSGSAMLMLQNCTISSNSASVEGGGIYNDDSTGGSTVLTIENCTFSGNHSEAGGDSIFNAASANTIMAITDTLLAHDNFQSNYFQSGNSAGFVLISGHNLSDDSSASAFATTVPNLLLGPLHNNGGPTLTHALLPGSPAINAGGGLDNVQQVAVSGESGTFTLTFNGQTTSALAFNATAAQVQAALNALSTIGGAGGSVEVIQNSGIYTVTFGGGMAGLAQPQMTGAGSGGDGVAVATLAMGGDILDEIQQVTLGESGGSFTLSFKGQTTPLLMTSSSAAQVQTALNALSTVGSGVTVVQGRNIYLVIFGGALGGTNQPQLVATGSFGATASVSTVVVGSGLPAFDQRGPGFARVVGGTVDVGAFESSIDLVASGASPVSGVEGQPLVSTNVASFTGQTGTELPGDYTATIGWGDGATTAGTITQPGGVGTAFLVAGNHTYAEEGSYTITATITHTSSGFSASATTSATISDAPLMGAPFSFVPVVAAPFSGQTVATFVDVNPNGALADFTATINWGDGTPPSLGNISQPGGTGTPFFVAGNHAYFAAGPVTITAKINDVGGSTATATTPVVVAQAGTTTSITPLPLSSVTGQPVTFTATVLPNAPSTGTPTGSLTFTVNGMPQPSQILSGGTATFMTSALFPTSSTISAAYGGDPNYISSSGTITQTVAKASTTTTLSSVTPGSFFPGQNLSATYSVSVTAPGAGTPTGTVTLTNETASVSGAAPGGTVSLLLTNTGTFDFTANYSGDTNFAPSSSSPAVSRTVLSMTDPSVFATTTVDHTSVRFRQTSLMQQQLTITNLTSQTLPAIRVTVHLSEAEIAKNIIVYNASGTNGSGEPYLQHNFPVVPGGSVTLTVEYYSPDRITVPNPTFTVEIVSPVTLVAPPGTSQPVLSKRTLSPDNAFLLDFLTVNGATYYILYSSDMMTWSVAQPPVAGTGSVVQWVDDGPPKTQSHPSTVPQRYYMVLKANSSVK